MEIGEIEKLRDFVLMLGKFPYIIDLKKRIEVGDLEYNLSLVQKELERSIQINPEDIITQYKRIWFTFNYFTEDDDSLKCIRTVNNIIMDELPMGKELITRARSHTTLNDFYVKNGIYTLDELFEINEIDGITGSNAIQHEKKILEKMLQDNLKDVDFNKIKHNFPTIDKKYNTDKIYNYFFLGVFAVCKLDSFNNWLVNGFEANKITLIKNGKISAKTGKRTEPIAQFRKFIETITENNTDLKDGYYMKVFDLKLNNIVTADNLSLKYIDMLKLCEN